jgi:hypothetical protein
VIAMPAAETVALTACGLFFLTALCAGIFKWRGMETSPDHKAPAYIDIAHRAALLYSFACLVLAEFVRESSFPPTVELVAVIGPIIFFALPVGGYILLGLRNETDNQFTEPVSWRPAFMIALIVAEIGGFSVLFAGFLVAHVL